MDCIVHGVAKSQTQLSDFHVHIWTSLVAQTVKRLSIMLETWVRSLGREESLEKEMGTHSSILAWKIPRTEEPGVHGVTKSRSRLSNFTFTLTFLID